ncbi:hypothetical protein [Halorubellus litoreus]|uniref:Uncharacterized protein n=1 Tax=Halorubellus litoreus TaxID=755308 RepID=A0ABD5VHI7_9EURY
MTDHQDEVTDLRDDATSRRRVLLGTGAIVGLAGCLGFGDDAENTTTGTGSRTDAATTTPASTTTGAETTTDAETSTESEATETEEEGPGYKQDHWHGRLFFEVDGDFVNFDQSKYYLDSIEDERPETVYFHFHGTAAHGPNEWSNEKQVVTFERALNLLPGIGYDTAGGSHVITYDGTTYDASRAGTSISIHRGTDSVDPTTYEVQHDDNFWVSVRTDGGSGGSGGTTTATSTESEGSGDARTGKLFVDVNNRRLEYEAGATDGNASGFEFRDDDQPSTWYDTGEATTLADALDALPDIEYEQASGGKHVVTYDANDSFDGTYRETASETQVLVRQRTNPVDPASYQLQDGDAVWVYVHTTNAPDNEH